MLSSLFGKKEEQSNVNTMPMLLELRETLYTRQSLEPFIARLQEESRSAFPWSNFVAANQAIKTETMQKRYRSSKRSSARKAVWRRASVFRHGIPLFHWENFLSKHCAAIHRE